MSKKKLIIEKETELLALHRILFETKFTPHLTDDRISASHFTANLANSTLEAIINLQCEQNASKLKSWKDWLEKKQPWIWRRSLSYLLQRPPFQWDKMKLENRFNYIRWVFSPYPIVDDEISKFIKEYEHYLQIRQDGYDSKLRTFGRATESMIEKFTDYHKISLPEDYKMFLKNNNGGTILTHYWLFIVQEINEAIPLEALYGIEIESSMSLEVWNRDKDEIPSHYLVIGESGDNGKILLDTSLSNGIYFMKNEFREEPESENGIYRIAESFDDFMKSLKKFDSKIRL
ncbi:hypothetical protein PTI45_04606 [Paenibacillus nuruki]|uniref:Knr4/Smi1-like domain-containing protein n=1 Tax=Paenibacillus nuruki TaxID=1886670 RepID=A0A1E3KYR9_9BACL|nr:SMI1/KNR4 family protein [Paenibacillus nuruki]ODP26045.1 hypothetical protein PTI45_04606 [Paenibacillus nuruki]